MNICKMLCYLMFSRWMFISEFSAWVSAIFNLIKVFIFKAIFGFVKSDRIWFYQITLSAVNDQFDLELTCEAAHRFASDKFPPFATLSLHSPDLSNKCSPFSVFFQSYFIFFKSTSSCWRLLPTTLSSSSNSVIFFSSAAARSIAREFSDSRFVNLREIIITWKCHH